MKILILIVSLLLNACTSFSKDNHGLGWDYDYITDSGIEFRLDYGSSTFTEEDLDIALQYMAECLGVSNPVQHNLMIVLVSPEVITNMHAGHSSDGRTPYGEFYTYPNLVVIKGGTHSNEDFRVSHTLQHEITHYLLYITTGNPDLGHVNESGNSCGY